MEKTEQKLTPLQKQYRRYSRIYNCVVYACIAAVVATFYFCGPAWGIAALIFGAWSYVCYESGANSNCIDEFEYACPANGFRRMFKSWIWLAIIAAVVYFFWLKF